MEPVNKKMKFSPGSLEQFENEAMNLHNIAMGYVTRPIQDVSNQDLIQLAMKEFPVPAELHDSFQSWICKNQLAKFDCFLNPSVECDCYKCKTVIGKVNADLNYFEDRLDSLENKKIEAMDVVQPFQQFVELPPMVHETIVPTNAVPLDVSVANVSHFYVDVPVTFGLAPSTPKLTTVEVLTVVSDHGKQVAQEKWVQLMQMTPTTLRF